MEQIRRSLILCDACPGRRVVFLSSIGAEKRHGAGFVDGLARIERRLDAAREETGTALLHLRCCYVMTNLLMDLDGLRAGRLATGSTRSRACRTKCRNQCAGY